MLRTRLLDTSTFRLTVVYLGLFSLSALAILLFVYIMSSRFMEQQTRETIEADVAGLHREYQFGKVQGLQRVIQRRSELEPDLNNIYALLDMRTGKLLAGNYEPPADWRPKPDGEFYRFEIPVEEPGRYGHTMHQALAQLVNIGDRYALVVGRDVQDKANSQQQIRIAITSGIGIMLVLGIAGGYVMSRWMLHRLEVINRTTARIMAGDLSRRIEVSDTDDEFDELGRNVNLMLDRIDRLLSSMRQVTDDIAHDLRTPLTRIRSRIELALMRDLDAEETRELLEATIRDADRLIETFNALLSIARAEAGGQHGEWEVIDLSGLAAEVFELYEPLAEEKGILLVLDAAPGVETHGSRQLVAQAIANLIDNAIKYTPAGGHVWLRTSSAPTPQVEVADDGPGIPPDQRERAKQRFVRLDATRSTSGGSGLGLSLVDAVARLHDAQLELLDNAPGLMARLTFPPASTSAAERAGRTAPERISTYERPPFPSDKQTA